MVRGRENIEKKGFSIVELLIVVSVIAIIATISVITYNGATRDTHETALKSTLQTAYTAIANELNTSSTSTISFPSTLSIKDGIVLQLTKPTTGDEFCINGYDSEVSNRWAYHSKEKLFQGLCPYTDIVETYGGSVPMARGVVINDGFRFWEQESGTDTVLSIGADNSELTVNDGSGSSTVWTSAPFITDGVSRIDLSMRAYGTSPATYHGANGGVVGLVKYYDADCSTPVYNPYYQPTNNYSTNDWTEPISLGSWSDVTHSIDIKKLATDSSIVKCARISVVAGGGYAQYSATGTKIKDFKIVLED